MSGARAQGEPEGSRSMDAPGPRAFRLTPSLILPLALASTLLLVAPARAEDAGAAPPNEIVIGGAPAPRPSFDGCVEVEIGKDRSFGCLNRQLRSEVDKIKPTIPAPPVDARSSDLKTGVVNIPAIQQQYGRNFGISVIPHREPSIYRGPLPLR
jgi:hypothetical protein